MSSTPRVVAYMSGRRAAMREQRGETLIEILVTVAIMGVFFVAAFGFMTTMYLSTATHNLIVRSANEVSAASEAIEFMGYIEPCGTVSAYQTAFNKKYTPPSNYTASVEVSGVTYLQDNQAPVAVFGPSCNSSDDQGVVRITLRVESVTGSHIGSNLTFTKRNSTCPASYAPQDGRPTEFQPINVNTTIPLVQNEGGLC